MQVPAVPRTYGRADAPAEGKRPNDQNDETFAAAQWRSTAAPLPAFFGRLAHAVQTLRGFQARSLARSLYLGPEVDPGTGYFPINPGRTGADRITGGVRMAVVVGRWWRRCGGGGGGGSNGKTSPNL